MLTLGERAGRLARVMTVAAGLGMVAVGLPVETARAEVTSEQVEQAIRDGIRYLRSVQRGDGSWPEFSSPRYRTGTTSLATLALLTAGVPPDDPTVEQALAALQEKLAR